MIGEIHEKNDLPGGRQLSLEKIPGEAEQESGAPAVLNIYLLAKLAGCPRLVISDELVEVAAL